MILVARVTCLSYQRVLQYRRDATGEVWRWRAWRRRCNGSCPGWQAGKRNPGSPGSVAVVILTASTKINHDCGVDCAWKSCCTIPYCTVPDLPIIASTVKTIGIFFSVQQKGDSFERSTVDLRSTGNCTLQYSWHEREMR